MNRNLSSNQSISYGWLIVACVFIFGFIDYGIRNSFSVFYGAILEEFKWSRADTAFIFSLCVLSYGLMAPISGRFADRFGPKKVIPIGAVFISIGMFGCAVSTELWHFYLFFGVVVAIGNCLAGFSQYLPLVGRWFVKSRVKALGITMAGGGLCLLLSLFTGYIINMFGWRNAFIISGVIASLVIIPLDLIFIKWPEENQLEPEENSINTNEIDSANKLKAVTFNKALKTTSFWLIFFINFLVWGIGLNMLLAHTVPHIEDIGFDSIFAASIYGLNGVFGAIGNSSSFLAARFRKEKTVAVSSISAILAIFLLATATASSPWKLYAWFILFGIGTGVLGPTLSALVVDLYKGKDLGAINGFLMLGFGIGGCLGPYAAGYIYDATKTYTLAFFLAIVALSISCAFVWIVSYINRNKLQ